MYSHINEESLKRIRHIQKVLRMTDEEFLGRINPKPSVSDEEWQEFSEYEQGLHKIPDRVFNRVLLLSYRNNLPISHKWLIFGHIG